MERLVPEIAIVGAGEKGCDPSSLLQKGDPLRRADRTALVATPAKSFVVDDKSVRLREGLPAPSKFRPPDRSAAVGTVRCDPPRECKWKRHQEPSPAREVNRCARQGGHPGHCRSGAHSAAQALSGDVMVSRRRACAIQPRPLRQHAARCATGCPHHLRGSRAKRPPWQARYAVGQSTCQPADRVRPPFTFVHRCARHEHRRMRGRWGRPPLCGGARAPRRERRLGGRCSALWAPVVETRHGPQGSSATAVRCCCCSWRRRDLVDMGRPHNVIRSTS